MISLHASLPNRLPLPPQKREGMMCLGWGEGFKLNQMKLLIFDLILKTTRILKICVWIPIDSWMCVSLFRCFEGRDFIDFCSPTHNFVCPQLLNGCEFNFLF